MAQFEVMNELCLKVTMQPGETLHAKCGSMIGFQGNMHFAKEILGPGSNIIGQAVGQLFRRFTGENMPIMKATARGMSQGYFAFEGQHITVLNLSPGERIAVESENIIAFEPTCKYGVMFLATGVVSQKGLATSTIEGPGNVAIMTDGNPIMLRGQCVVDPDAMVAFTGAQPTIGLDLDLRNLIGQASGESYNLKFNDPNNIVIIQPSERKSGISIGMDGGSTGQRADVQQNQSISEAGQSIGNTLGQLGNILGGNGGGLGGLFR